MTHEESVKLDNYKAHYRTILSNINISNKSLEEVLSKETEATKGLMIVEAGIESANTELDTITKEAVEITSRLDKRESLLKQKERELGKRDEETKKIQEELTETLNTVKTAKQLKIDAYMRSLERKVEDLEIEHTVSKGALEIRESVSKKLDKQIENLREEMRRAAENYSEITKVRDTSLLNLTKEIESAVARLRALRIKLLEESEKVGSADQMLVERGKDLTRKERDFLILTLRWKKFFKEHFPNQELKL